MNRVRDLGYSLLRDVGSDSSDALGEHFAVLGKIALDEFIRFGRGVPSGFFEEASLRFSGKMQDIQLGNGKPIIIMPIGNLPVQVVNIVARIAWEVFGAPVRIMRSRTIWADVYNPKNQQADADGILKKVAPFSQDGRVIVLTDVELFSSAQNISVYGYGNMIVPLCVTSTFGFGFGKAQDYKTWARLIKVVVHELGHTFGLCHHEEENLLIPCVMNMQKSVDGKMGLDFLTHEFCSRCLGDIMSGHSQQLERISKKGEPPCSVRS